MYCDLTLAVPMKTTRLAAALLAFFSATNLLSARAYADYVDVTWSDTAGDTLNATIFLAPTNTVNGIEYLSVTSIAGSLDNYSLALSTSGFTGTVAWDNAPPAELDIPFNITDTNSTVVWNGLIQWDPSSATNNIIGTYPRFNFPYCPGNCVSQVTANIPEPPAWCLLLGGLWLVAGLRIGAVRQFWEGETVTISLQQ
jgi:hypothetical protein